LISSIRVLLRLEENQKHPIAKRAKTVPSRVPKNKNDDKKDTAPITPAAYIVTTLQSSEVIIALNAG
jgi:hypothetical protein